MKGAPRKENLDLAKKYIRRIHYKYLDNENYHKWWEYCNLIYSEMNYAKWFFNLKYWICRELLKSNESKEKREYMNKALLLSGKSGVGKTSFWRTLINPVFKCLEIKIGDYIYQSPDIKGENLKVFISPDDATLDEMYDFTQVLHGEVCLQIKKENTPLDTMYKSGIICTNLSGKDLKGPSERGRADFTMRLNRRLITADMGKDRLLSKFTHGSNLDGLNPPKDFRCYFFWKMMLNFKDNKELEKGDKLFRKPEIFDINDVKKVGKDSVIMKRYQNALDGEKTVVERSMFPEYFESDSGVDEEEKK